MKQAVFLSSKNFSAKKNKTMNKFISVTGDSQCARIKRAKDVTGFGMQSVIA